MKKRPPRSLDVNQALTSHPEEARHIANIIALWNSTEYWLTLLFAMLAPTPPRPAQIALYALRNSAARLDVISDTGEHALKQSTLLPEFLELMTQLRKALKTRNMYAHGIYAVDEKNRLTIYDPTYDWPSQQEAKRIVTLKSLEAVWEAAMQVANAIGTMHQRASKRLPRNHPWHALPGRFE